MQETAWKDYFERTRNSKPRPLLVKAAELAKEKGDALDLGSGAFNDVNFLLSVGFERIIAVDKVPVADEIFRSMPEGKVSYVISRFEDLDLPEDHFDLVNAQYSLPFIEKADFGEVFGKIIRSLKAGAVFTGQFFGERDEWNKGDGKMTFHTKEEAEKLLSEFKMIEFTEEEKDGSTAAGKQKHWHVFHFIAIK